VAGIVCSRLKRNRSIWTFWKVLKVRVIRDSRKESQPAQGGKRHAEPVFSESYRKVKRIKSDLPPFLSVSPLLHHDYQSVRVAESIRTSTANLDLQELGNVTI
jgi:hypothetical protein